LQTDNPAGAEVVAATTATLTGTARASDATPSDADRGYAKLTTAPDPEPAGDEIDDMLDELLEQERRDRVLLSHVAGLDAVEQRLETSFLGPIRNPALMDILPRARRLGPKRNWLRGDSIHNVVAQLSNELDSVAANNEGVFVLAATNQPWKVATALRSPGRFDRTILVTPPDATACEAILTYHLRQAPTTACRCRSSRSAPRATAAGT